MGESTTNNTTDSKQGDALPCPQPFDQGIWYRSATSSLWYDTKSRDAAGDIDAVRVDGIVFSRASLAAPQGDAADVLKVLAGRHHAEHHKQFPLESCPAWPCDILRAAASSQLPADPPPTPPRCPKCGYVMCQQFDSRPVNAIADIATPNGKYICYYCTPAEPRQEGEQEPCCICEKVNTLAVCMVCWQGMTDRFVKAVQAPEASVVAREFAREWMNTHHASLETNQEREDALAAIITRYLDRAPARDFQKRLFDECVMANWDPECKNTFAEEVAHLHEELSEAFRAWRRYKDCKIREVNGKLEGVPIEFADALIGMFYNAELHGFDLLAAIETKHQFNLTRNYVQEDRQLHAAATPLPETPVGGEQETETCPVCKNEVPLDSLLSYNNEPNVVCQGCIDAGRF